MKKNKFTLIYEILILIILAVLAIINIKLEVENYKKEQKINELQNKVYQQIELIDALNQ